MENFMPDHKLLSIGISVDPYGWYEEFVNAAEKKIASGYPCKYEVINLDEHDWVQQAEPFDVILWKPRVMGVRSASYFKEKIYFLQYVAKKLVIPNFETVWHFESKAAQSYLFSHYGIKTPETIVTFDYHDAHRLINQSAFPVVIKKPHGAGSSNVYLETNKGRAEKTLKMIFRLQLWDEARRKASSRLQVFFENIFSKWMWATLFERIFRISEDYNVAYWQEYIPGNQADLRITVIGDCYAYGFWRNNRPNDFRASGSGLIDYERDIPEEQLRYCLDLNRKLGFDSMCYDILFKENDFVITEISFGYKASAIYNTKGHYVLSKDGSISYVEGHTWPQELWFDWALRRAESLFNLEAA